MACCVSITMKAVIRHVRDASLRHGKTAPCYSGRVAVLAKLWRSPFHVAKVFLYTGHDGNSFRNCALAPTNVSDTGFRGRCAMIVDTDERNRG